MKSHFDNELAKSYRNGVGGTRVLVLSPIRQHTSSTVRVNGEYTISNLKYYKPMQKSKINIFMPFTAFQMDPKEDALNTLNFLLVLLNK